jgi:hypothetical protein
MLYGIACLIVALGVLLSVGDQSGGQEKPASEEVQRAEQAVKADLQKKKGAHAQLLPRDEPILKKVFPEQNFVVARFRQFPVANQVPEGLRASNLFAVTKKEQQVQYIPDPGAMEKFFRAEAVTAANEAAARDVLAAWLALAQEFQQDGFYKFEVLDKDFAVEGDKGNYTVRGRALVVQGGKGELGATLAFQGGKLAKATEAGKIFPGPRPICQATKLLDPDPIVRKMAEQDLLFMGLAARDYLFEQYARADPELRAAIDRIWRKIRAEGW